MKGMILTAGLGTRLQPLTKNTPKALVKVGDYSMLDLSITYLHKHGVDKIIINVHHLADQLMEYVAHKRWQGFNIEISDETGELMNTGGGLRKASWFFEPNEDFVLVAVDVLTDLDLTAMVNSHKSQKALATLAVKKRETSRDLVFDKNGRLAGWKDNRSGETKDVDSRIADKNFGFSGIHVVNSKIFELMQAQSEWDGAFSIIDLYLQLAEKHDICAFEHSEGRWIEFGRAENIENAIQNDDYKSIMDYLASE